MKKWTALPLMILAAGPVGSATAQSSQNPVSRTLTAQDLDIYGPIQGGTRFKSTGVVIAPSPEGATGNAYLKDGGHYEDVYVKTSDGWRFKSRTYRPS